MNEAPARYGLVLIGIIGVIVMTAFADEGGLLAFVAVLVQGIVLLFVLHTSGIAPRMRRVAWIIVIVATLAGAGALVLGGDGGDRAAAFLSAALVVATPAAILHRVARQPSIDRTVVAGAVCIYLLIGLFFAQVYMIQNAWMDDPFFAQPVEPSAVDFTYFSFVTLTTVGYGDLSAAGDLGRVSAITEALLGQLYLVTVVALVVSRIGHERPMRGGG